MSWATRCHGGRCHQCKRRKASSPLCSIAGYACFFFFKWKRRSWEASSPPTSAYGSLDIIENYLFSLSGVFLPSQEMNFGSLFFFFFFSFNFTPINSQIFYLYPYFLKFSNVVHKKFQFCSLIFLCSFGPSDHF